MAIWTDEDQRQAMADLEHLERSGTPAEKRQLAQYREFAKVIAPVLERRIADALQPLADLIVEQGRTISAQAERIALLERTGGYEVVGTDAKGKPRVRRIGRAA